MGASNTKPVDEISAQLCGDPQLAQKNFPNPNGETVKLSDGRTLGYAIYGDDNAPSERTMLLMHGTPGTRFFFSRTHEEYLKREHARALVVERPGFGLSTQNSSRTLLSTVDDARELVDRLGYPRVHVLGFSAGGPYALAFAKSYAERCLSVAIVSSLSPNVAGVTQGMTAVSKFGYMLASRCPSVLRVIVKGLGKKMVQDPYKAWVDELTEQEREIFVKDLELRRLFAMCVMEQYGRESGARAEADDYALFAGAWGFELSEIDENIPIVIYGGGADNKCTPAMYEAIVERLPGSNLQKVFAENETHFYFYKLFTDRLFSDIGLAATSA